MSALPTSTRMLRIDASTPVDRDAEAPSSTVNSIAPLLTLDLADAITLALARCGLSHKDAAFTMGLDPAQWSRHLTLERRGEIETIFATCHRGVPVHRGVREGWFTACDRCEAVVEVLHRELLKLMGEEERASA